MPMNNRFGRLQNYFRCSDSNNKKCIVKWTHRFFHLILFSDNQCERTYTPIHSICHTSGMSAQHCQRNINSYSLTFTFLLAFAVPREQTALKRCRMRCGWLASVDSIVAASGRFDRPLVIVTTIDKTHSRAGGMNYLHFIFNAMRCDDRSIICLERNKSGNEINEKQAHSWPKWFSCRAS